MTTDDEREVENDRVTERASISRNVFHMMSAQVVTWTVAIASSIVIPRKLGPSLMGQLHLATSIWLIGSILAALGTSRFLQLQIARSQRRGLTLVGPIMVVRTIVFGGVAGVLALIGLLTTPGRVLTVLMVLIGIDKLISAWSETINTAFVGLERMATPALVSATTRVVGVMAAIAYVVLTGDVYGMVAIGIVAVSLGAVVLWWRFRRIARIDLAGWRGSARTVVKGSLPFMMSGAALVLYQQIDIIAISAAAESEDLGWYGTADALFGTLLFPAAVLTSTIFPTLGRLHAADPPGLHELVRRTFATLIMIAVPIGLGTTLIASTFAPLLYGEQFRETGAVLEILGPVIILTFGTILFGTVAQATGRVRLWTAVLLLSSVLTVPLDLALVPWANDRFDNGAIGGAIAYLVTEGVQFAIGLAVVAPYLIGPVFGWRVTRILLAGGGMFAAGWPFRDAFILAPVGVCAFTYVALLFALRVITDEERRWIGSLVVRFGVGRSKAVATDADAPKAPRSPE